MSHSKLLFALAIAAISVTIYLYAYPQFIKVGMTHDWTILGISKSSPALTASSQLSYFFFYPAYKFYRTIGNESRPYVLEESTK